jgi:hypothetical protein
LPEGKGEYEKKKQRLGSTVQDSDGVGTVIACLMKMADVAGVEPTSLALGYSEDSKIEQSLVSKFFNSKLPGMTDPVISLISAKSIRLRNKMYSLARYEQRESSSYRYEGEKAPRTGTTSN